MDLASPQYRRGFLSHADTSAHMQCQHSLTYDGIYSVMTLYTPSATAAHFQFG
jgi:hypothetical protein